MKTLFIIAEPKGKFNFALCNKRAGKWNFIQGSTGQYYEHKKDCEKVGKTNNPSAKKVQDITRKEFNALFEKN